MDAHHLYLFGKKFVPYFEEQSAGTIPPMPESDFPAKGPSRWQKLRGQILRIYRQVENKFPFDEKLCTYLFSAKEVHIHYPAGVSEEKVRRALRHYFRHQKSKHRFWVGVDLLLACLGSLLAILPGPNLFFFYPAVRVYGHYCAWKGAGRGLHSALRMRPSEEIRSWESRIRTKASSDILTETSLLSEKLNLPGLSAFLSQKKIYH